MIMRYHRSMRNQIALHRIAGPEQIRRALPVPVYLICVTRNYWFVAMCIDRGPPTIEGYRRTPRRRRESPS